MTFEAKADLITQLASDPQAVSLMREMVSKGEASSAGANNNVVSASNKLQSLNINRNDSTDSTDEIRKQTLAGASSQGDVLSPPIEFNRWILPNILSATDQYNFNTDRRRDVVTVTGTGRGHWRESFNFLLRIR